MISGYCSGDYGIDNSDLTRFCVFHGLLFKCASKIIDMCGEDSGKIKINKNQTNLLNGFRKIID